MKLALTLPLLMLSSIAFADTSCFEGDKTIMACSTAKPVVEGEAQSLAVCVHDGVHYETYMLFQTEKGTSVPRAVETEMAEGNIVYSAELNGANYSIHARNTIGLSVYTGFMSVTSATKSGGETNYDCK